MSTKETEIPTAEEYCNQLFIESFADTFEEPRHTPIVEAFRKFAQLHAEAALKAASEKAKVKSYTTTVKKTILGEIHSQNWEVDRFSILSSYPPENIK